jgi:CheY-like chemotaxis protein
MSSILTNTTILVVEDNEDTREFLQTMLEHTGANVLAADSAETALASYRHNPPDIIVSDMRLGSSDGYAFITAIREYNKEYRGFTPAIALTGFVYPGDEDRAIAAGFNAYMSKPFNPQDLISTIARLLHEQRHDAA